MSRLTERDTVFGWVIKGKFCIVGDVDIYNQAVDKLAAYEDIGEPEDLIRPVRCRECKYIYITPISGHSFCKHPHWNIHIGSVSAVNQDDYCSYGEREKSE